MGKEWGSGWLHPEHSALLLAEAVVILQPGLIIAEIMGQNSIVLYGLAIVCFYFSPPYVSI